MYTLLFSADLPVLSFARPFLFPFLKMTIGFTHDMVVVRVYGGLNALEDSDSKINAGSVLPKVFHASDFTHNNLLLTVRSRHPTLYIREEWTCV